MIKKLVRKALTPLFGKLAARKLARKADKALMKEADKRTGGLASKVDEAV